LKYQKRHSKKEGSEEKDKIDRTILEISSSLFNLEGRKRETDKVLTRSNHAGSGGILTKIGHGGLKSASKDNRADAGPGTQCAKRPSSNCLTWSISGLQSTNAASHPKASESIAVAAFKFKPGPFRSSSVGKLAKSEATIPNRAHSDGCTDDILNLTGISSSIELPEVVLSRDGAQQVDKEPHGARNRIFELQVDARPPSICSQKSIDTKLLSKRGNQMRGRSSVYESQPLHTQVSYTDRIDSSMSIDNLLGQCYQAQQEVAESLALDESGLLETEMSEGEVDEPPSTSYSLYSGTRHQSYDMPKESYEDDGDQGKIGLNEGYEVMDEEILETYPSFDGNYGEFFQGEVGEEGFSRNQHYASFVQEGKIDETLEHDRIDDMGYPTLPGLYQSTRKTDKAQRRFWRPNKLY
jgi:hypothetical protein